MEKIKIGIVGATGYAGAELVRLLLNHPNAEITAVSSISFEGQNIADIYPNLKKVCEMTLGNTELMPDCCDVIFAALPSGLSEELALQCAGKCVIIDLGADFRLHDQGTYEKWYGKNYKSPELHTKSVYSLPELYREQTKNCDVIGNPGCYPTSVALGMMPALRSGCVSTDGIIVDSKSGVTGAGRSLTQGTHYPDTNEAFAAYKAGAHRHTPEIEQTLSDIAGKNVKITFVPHLLPVNRGIESTIYARLIKDITLAELHEIYEKAYENEYFVRVEPMNKYANIKNVRCSNFCDISLHLDTHTNTLIISSCIDNMVKGAAGQAIQNMNIRFSLPETTGLTDVPPAF
ncbi:MAG: N-acetyl-gamma-glutamyl-phosphate reductase [Eubacteriales bacterium]